MPGQDRTLLGLFARLDLAEVEEVRRGVPPSRLLEREQLLHRGARRLAVAVGGRLAEPLVQHVHLVEGVGLREGRESEEEGEDEE